MKQSKLTIRISEKDLMQQGYTQEFINKFFEHQNQLLKNRTLSTFIKNSVIEKSTFVLNDEQEKYNQLLHLIKAQGIDEILTKLTQKQANLDILEQLKGILSQNNTNEVKTAILDDIEPQKEIVELKEDEINNILAFGSF